MLEQETISEHEAVRGILLALTIALVLFDGEYSFRHLLIVTNNF